MEGPAVHQCKPSRRCRCIQRGRRGTGVSSERAVHVAAAAEWVGVTPEHFAHARPPLRTPRISGRSRCGGHSARWDVPRPRAAHSGYFEGSRPRSQRGGWRRPASSSAACTGPSRYSTHKVGLEDMGGPDPPAGWACALPERAAARQLSGLRAAVEPPRALACDSSAPNAAPISPLVMYRPATRAAAPRSRLPAGTRPSGGPEAAAAGAPRSTCWKKMRCEDLQKSDQTLRDQKLDGRAHLLTRGGLTCSGLPPRSRSGAERALSAQALRADAAVERWLLRRSARGGAMRGSEAFCST